MARQKIKTREDLADIVKKEKASGKTVGFTNGCFDILHLGHIRYLKEAKMFCDILVIGVNSDSSVKTIKGHGRPVNDEVARAEVLAALDCVDFLSVFEEETPKELIEALTPNVLFKGGDWEEDDVVGGSHVREHGGEVKIIPYVEGYSTTKLIKKIKGTNG
jgi:D-beta-D-heptose 7-phosphate kinase/D-beta-D-heptose 1-phosphate adenosyltransferase